MNRDRGQTTLDFAIGIGVFIVVIIITLAFIPTALQPFDTGIDDDSVSADRVATRLAEGLLGSPSEPYVIDTGCLVAFFAQTIPDSGECEFSDGGDPLSDLLGIPDTQPVSVRLEGDFDSDANDPTDTLCWDTPDSGASPPEQGQLVEEGDSECDIVLSRGGSPGGQSVVNARRAVSIDGTDARLVVRMW